MNYYLDTDTVSLLERGNVAISRHLSEQDPATVMLTVITIQEQINGRFQMIAKAKSPQALADAYQQFADTFLYLRDLPVTGFSHNAILRFESLLKMKLNVGKNDLRIAAIALEADAVVVTRNRRDFGRIPDLRIEDWTEE